MVCLCENFQQLKAAIHLRRVDCVWTRVFESSKEVQCVWPTGPFDRPAIVLHCRVEISEGSLVAPSVNGPDAVLFSFKFLSTFLYYFCLPTSCFFPCCQLSYHIAVCMPCTLDFVNTGNYLSPLWIELWAGRPDNKLVRIVCKVRVNNLWVWLLCCALRVYMGVRICGVCWIVSQLSMYEMLVACIPIVFSYFEFPWIIIF